MRRGWWSIKIWKYSNQGCCYLQKTFWKRNSNFLIEIIYLFQILKVINWLLNSRYIEHGNCITCNLIGLYESDIRNNWCTGYAVTINRISRLYSQVLPRRILLMKCFPVLIIHQYSASSTHNTRKPQRNMQIILNLYTGLRTCSLRLIIRSLDFGNSLYQILIQELIHSFIQPIATG